MYAIYLWIAVTVISFIVTILRGRSCCGGPVNAYEHFQDAGTINEHFQDAGTINEHFQDAGTINEHFQDAGTINSSLYKSLLEMTATIDQHTQNLQNLIGETGTMTSQTCSLYDSVRNKFIKSKAAEAPDSSEFQLPKRQQELLEKNRAKNAENTWQNQIEMYKFRRGGTVMIDCTKVNVAASSNPDATEGFQDTIPPTTIDSASQTLLGKAVIFGKLLDSPAVQQWLNDCKAIKGTANYVNMYINNVQAQAMLDKCKGDYVKNTKGFKEMGEKDQEKVNNAANFQCTLKFGKQFENFENPPYVNTQFAYPVGFPTASMTQSQRDGYGSLTVGQVALDKFSKAVGTTYQDAMAAYKRMNATNNTYIAYKKQVDSVSETNYTQAQAKSF
jgi:hypothetical protein